MVALLVLAAVASADAQITEEALLHTLQRTLFHFFWNEADPTTGLIRDRSADWSPCSIASTGFGLTAICIGIDHGWITRTAGRERVLMTLQTFWNAPQGSATSGVAGYKGLFYHFLDMSTAERVWDCELSAIDTALLFAGIFDVKEYFDRTDSLDVVVRSLADSITTRAEWDWIHSGWGIRMGWKPDTGFSGYGDWIGYNEAMILYIIALGSPTHPVPAYSWSAWTSGYDWRNHYGYEYVEFPPLFGHQYSHCWIDFRCIRDAYMEGKGIDYFENSRRATLAAERDGLGEQQQSLLEKGRLRRRIGDFAGRVLAALDGLDFEESQRLIRLVVEQVRITGAKVEIHFRIPLDEPPDGPGTGPRPPP